MKAIVAHQYGAPDSLVFEDWPTRAPDAQEVRVKVHSAGISFVDMLVVAGKYQWKPPLPFVPGSEFSGEIIEVGAEVRDLAPGDRVCGGNMGGILAQELTLPASRVQKLPAHVCMDEAAVLRASYLTAWYALIERGQLATGETVLVLGAAGAVSAAACQIAKLFGATVIASASSPAKRAFALENGVDLAVDSGAPDWREQIKAATNGRGVDIVVDPVGGAITERAFRSLAYKGRHLIIGFAAGEIPSLPANLPLLKGAALVGAFASQFTEREPEAADAARAQILELFAAGKLRPQIGRVYPLEEYAAALQAAATGESIGRVLLRMQ